MRQNAKYPNQSAQVNLGVTPSLSLLLAMACLAPMARAQAPAGCGEPKESEFAISTLSDGRSEVIAMAVAPDGRVFAVEKVTGKVMLYKPDTRTTVEAARLSVYATGSTASSPGNRADGLLGIALDPGFASNQWLYLYYSVAGDAAINRVSRFTVVGDRLDMASERKVLDVPTHRRECCHSAGDMEFDAAGNLLITTGDNAIVTTGKVNAGAEGTSGNTNDLRGKILRIRPDPAGTYTIPAGNLFPPGKDSTRPEIYAMGMRNPFRMAVDPERGWILSSDVGPDGSTEVDELNLIKDAGNYGWPYFIGADSYRPDGPQSPVNTSSLNKGLRVLPPVRPPTFSYRYAGSTQFPGFDRGGRVAGAGPIYRYNPALASTVKFPPFFHGKWFIFDYRQRWIMAATLDAQGNFTAVKDWFVTGLVRASGFTRVADMKFGPDGALYVLEYGSMSDYTPSSSGALHKIEYRPPRPECLPSTPLAVLPGAPAPRGARLVHGGPGSRFTLPVPASGITLHDGSGRKVWERRTGERRHNLTLEIPAELPAGIYHWRPIP